MEALRLIGIPHWQFQLHPSNGPNMKSVSFFDLELTVFFSTMQSLEEFHLGIFERIWNGTIAKSGIIMKFVELGGREPQIAKV